MKLTLAITNYNRTDLLFESYKSILSDDRINEILIVDDHSELSNYTIVEDETSIFKKIKLVRNEVNKGMQLNKAVAVSIAKNEWVILFDSDNVIGPKYLDAFFQIKDLKPNCIYMPDKALPKYDFSKHSGKYIGAHYIAENIKDGALNICLNTCNYIVNRDYYLDSFIENKNVKGVDTVYHAMNHLMNDGIFYIVPGMEYYHRTHAGSEFLKDLDYNMKMGALIRNEIIKLNKVGMITCGLKGRFGNHLFIMATVIATALKHGMRYHIPKSEYFDRFENLAFNPDLRTKVIPERVHSYVPLPIPNKSENMKLTGHYQTEKYFKEYRKQILDAFDINPIQSNYIAIHVRRGDYLEKPKSFPFVGREYFIRGIEYFKSKGHNLFMVFGDDIEWNKENINYPGCEFIYRNGDMWQDFSEMAGCTGHIISNSTFSWWAAWIADKETVAPKIWFGDGARLDTKDIIPDRWIKF